MKDKASRVSSAIRELGLSGADALTDAGVATRRSVFAAAELSVGVSSAPFAAERRALFEKRRGEAEAVIKELITRQKHVITR